MSKYGYKLNTYKDAKEMAMKHYNDLKSSNALTRDVIDIINAEHLVKHELDFDNVFFYTLWGMIMSNHKFDLDEPFKICGVSYNDCKEKAQEYYQQAKARKLDLSKLNLDDEKYIQGCKSEEGLVYARKIVHIQFLYELRDLITKQ